MALDKIEQQAFMDMNNDIEVKNSLIESLKSQVSMYREKCDILTRHLEIETQNRERLQVNGTILQIEINRLIQEQWAVRRLGDRPDIKEINL